MNGRAAAAGVPEVAAPDPRVLREVACALCGSERRRTRFEEAPYRVVECQDCGLVYVTPRRDPERLRAMYLEDYWCSPSAKDFGYTNYLRDAELYRKTFRRRFAAIARHFPRPGRVLDVGCAAGYFLSIANERGWECSGVEVSERMAAFARDRYGLEVRVGTLADARFPDGRFDLVTMWDVLEHIPDPAAALREARRVMARGGLLLIETQNVASRFARWMGPKWHHYKHAEHLFHFDPKTIRALLSKCGFEVVELRSSLAGKYVSLDFVVERANRLHPAVSALLFPLKALGRASVYVNLFDEMLVFAK